MEQNENSTHVRFTISLLSRWPQFSRVVCTFALAITCDISGQQMYVLFCKSRDLENEDPASSDVQIPVLPKHSEPIAILKVNDSPDDD